MCHVFLNLFNIFDWFRLFVNKLYCKLSFTLRLMVKSYKVLSVCLYLHSMIIIFVDMCGALFKVIRFT